MVDEVARGARAHPRRLALDDGQGGYSYGALDAAADRFAHRLDTLGVRSGDAVALLAETCAEAVIALYGIPRAGALAVPLNPTLSDRELAGALELIGPRLLFVGPHPRVAKRARRLARSGRSAVVLFGDPSDEGPRGAHASGGPVAHAAGSPAAARPPTATREGRTAAEGDRCPTGESPPHRKTLPPPDPAAPVAVLRTSGTGGQARAVVLTRKNFNASSRATAARLGLGPGDVWYASLSLAHIGGMALVRRAFSAGSRVVVRGPFQLDTLIRLIETGRISHVSLVPTMLRLLLREGARSLPGPLRCVLVGGASVSPALVARALAAGLPLALTYGMTETCSQVATAPPARVRGKNTTAGTPLEGVELRIAPDGEIQVRGDVVASGYYPNEPIADAGGWYATGDLGRLDCDGDLAVVGRKADRIVSGGVNVDPHDVEQVLCRHPSVAEAGAAGVPDAEWGEVVGAALVPAGTARVPLEALRRLCRELLGPASRPRILRVLGALPHTPNGKLDRSRLAVLLAQPRPSSPGALRPRPQNLPDAGPEPAVPEGASHWPHARQPSPLR